MSIGFLEGVSRFTTDFASTLTTVFWIARSIVTSKIQSILVSQSFQRFTIKLFEHPMFLEKPPIQKTMQFLNRPLASKCPRFPCNDLSVLKWWYNPTIMASFDKGV